MAEPKKKWTRGDGDDGDVQVDSVAGRAELKRAQARDHMDAEEQVRCGGQARCVAPSCPLLRVERGLHECVGLAWRAGWGAAVLCGGWVGSRGARCDPRGSLPHPPLPPLDLPPSLPP